MSTRSSDARPKAAFLFPGQGSQAVGMGLDLYQSSPAAKAVFDEVDEALGEPFSRIIFEGPEDELRKTVNTQPGILTVSIACLKAAEEALGSDRMPVAAMAAGHSLGEYTASGGRRRAERNRRCAPGEGARSAYAVRLRAY